MILYPVKRSTAASPDGSSSISAADPQGAQGRPSQPVRPGSSRSLTRLPSIAETAADGSSSVIASLPKSGWSQASPKASSAQDVANALMQAANQLGSPARSNNSSLTSNPRSSSVPAATIHTSVHSHPTLPYPANLVAASVSKSWEAGNGATALSVKPQPADLTDGAPDQPVTPAIRARGLAESFRTPIASATAPMTGTAGRHRSTLAADLAIEAKAAVERLSHVAAATNRHASAPSLLPGPGPAGVTTQHLPKSNGVLVHEDGNENGGVHEGEDTDDSEPALQRRTRRLWQLGTPDKEAADVQRSAAEPWDAEVLASPQLTQLPPWATAATSPAAAVAQEHQDQAIGALMREMMASSKQPTSDQAADNDWDAALGIPDAETLPSSQQRDAAQPGATAHGSRHTSASSQRASFVQQQLLGTGAESQAIPDPRYVPYSETTSGFTSPAPGPWSVLPSTIGSYGGSMTDMNHSVTGGAGSRDPAADLRRSDAQRFTRPSADNSTVAVLQHLGGRRFSGSPLEEHEGSETGGVTLGLEYASLEYASIGDRSSAVLRHAEAKRFTGSEDSAAQPAVLQHVDARRFSTGSMAEDTSFGDGITTAYSTSEPHRAASKASSKPPIENPSKGPSQAPSRLASLAASQAPSQAASQAPSKAVGMKPSKPPSIAPDVSPGKAASMAPSKVTSMAPSVASSVPGTPGGWKQPSADMSISMFQPAGHSRNPSQALSGMESLVEAPHVPIVDIPSPQLSMLQEQIRALTALLQMLETPGEGSGQVEGLAMLDELTASMAGGRAGDEQLLGQSVTASLRSTPGGSLTSKVQNLLTRLNSKLSHTGEEGAMQLPGAMAGELTRTLRALSESLSSVAGRSPGGGSTPSTARGTPSPSMRSRKQHHPSLLHQQRRPAPVYSVDSSSAPASSIEVTSPAHHRSRPAAEQSHPHLAQPLATLPEGLGHAQPRSSHASGTSSVAAGISNHSSRNSSPGPTSAPQVPAVLVEAPGSGRSSQHVSRLASAARVEDAPAHHTGSGRSSQRVSRLASAAGAEDVVVAHTASEQASQRASRLASAAEVEDSPVAHPGSGRSSQLVSRLASAAGADDALAARTNPQQVVAEDPLGSGDYVRSMQLQGVNVADIAAAGSQPISRESSGIEHLSRRLDFDAAASSRAISRQASASAAASQPPLDDATRQEVYAEQPWAAPGASQSSGRVADRVRSSDLSQRGANGQQQSPATAASESLRSLSDQIAARSTADDDSHAATATWLMQTAPDTPRQTADDGRSTRSTSLAQTDGLPSRHTSRGPSMLPVDSVEGHGHSMHSPSLAPEDGHVSRRSSRAGPVPPLDHSEGQGHSTRSASLAPELQAGSTRPAELSQTIAQQHVAGGSHMTRSHDGSVRAASAVAGATAAEASILDNSEAGMWGGNLGLRSTVSEQLMQYVQEYKQGRSGKAQPSDPAQAEEQALKYALQRMYTNLGSGDSGLNSQNRSVRSSRGGSVAQGDSTHPSKDASRRSTRGGSLAQSDPSASPAGSKDAGRHRSQGRSRGSSAAAASATSSNDPSRRSSRAESVAAGQMDSRAVVDAASTVHDPHQTGGSLQAGVALGAMDAASEVQAVEASGGSWAESRRSGSAAVRSALSELLQHVQEHSDVPLSPSDVASMQEALEQIDHAEAAEQPVQEPVAAWSGSSVRSSSRATPVDAAQSIITLLVNKLSGHLGVQLAGQDTPAALRLLSNLSRSSAGQQQQQQTRGTPKAQAQPAGKQGLAWGGITGIDISLELSLRPDTVPEPAARADVSTQVTESFSLQSARPSLQPQPSPPTYASTAVPVSDTSAAAPPLVDNLGPSRGTSFGSARQQLASSFANAQGQGAATETAADEGSATPPSVSVFRGLSGRYIPQPQHASREASGSTALLARPAVGDAEVGTPVAASGNATPQPASGYVTPHAASGVPTPHNPASGVSTPQQATQASTPQDTPGNSGLSTPRVASGRGAAEGAYWPAMPGLAAALAISQPPPGIATPLQEPASGRTTPQQASTPPTPGPASGLATPQAASGIATPLPESGRTTPRAASGFSTPQPASGMVTPMTALQRGFPSTTSANTAPVAAPGTSSAAMRPGASGAALAAAMSGRSTPLAAAPGEAGAFGSSGAATPQAVAVSGRSTPGAASVSARGPYQPIPSSATSRAESGAATPAARSHKAPSQKPSERSLASPSQPASVAASVTGIPPATPAAVAAQSNDGAARSTKASQLDSASVASAASSSPTSKPSGSSTRKSTSSSRALSQGSSARGLPPPAAATQAATLPLAMMTYKLLSAMGHSPPPQEPPPSKISAHYPYSPQAADLSSPPLSPLLAAVHGTGLQQGAEVAVSSSGSVLEGPADISVGASSTQHLAAAGVGGEGADEPSAGFCDDCKQDLMQLLAPEEEQEEEEGVGYEDLQYGGMEEGSPAEHLVYEAEHAQYYNDPSRVDRKYRGQYDRRQSTDPAADGLGAAKTAIKDIRTRLAALRDVLQPQPYSMAAYPASLSPASMPGPSRARLSPATHHAYRSTSPTRMMRARQLENAARGARNTSHQLQQLGVASASADAWLDRAAALGPQQASGPLPTDRAHTPRSLAAGVYGSGYAGVDERTYASPLASTLRSMGSPPKSCCAMCRLRRELDSLRRGVARDAHLAEPGTGSRAGCTCGRGGPASSAPVTPRNISKQLHNL